MNKEDWLQEIKRALDLCRQNKRNEARKLLLSLLKRIRKQNKAQLDTWDESETASFIAMLYEEDGNLQLAANYHIKGAEFHTSWFTSHAQAAAHRIARAALCYFQIGKKRKAIQLADRALKLNALKIDPDPIYEQLIQNVRKYYEDRAATKQKSPHS